MTQLDEALQGLKEHDGVEHVLLAGADGLLVRHVGDVSALDPDRVAAMIPGIVSAGDTFGRATTAGPASTHVLELEQCGGDRFHGKVSTSIGGKMKGPGDSMTADQSVAPGPGVLRGFRAALRVEPENLPSGQAPHGSSLYSE